jgi:hypothetical protein
VKLCRHVRQAHFLTARAIEPVAFGGGLLPGGTERHQPIRYQQSATSQTLLQSAELRHWLPGNHRRSLLATQVDVQW